MTHASSTFEASAWLYTQIYTGEGQHDSVPIDGKPHYLIGKDQVACDVVLSDSSCSHQHAAVVHHQDGRLYLIDLASVSAVPSDL